MLAFMLCMIVAKWYVTCPQIVDSTMRNHYKAKRKRVVAIMSLCFVLVIVAIIVTGSIIINSLASLTSKKM